MTSGGYTMTEGWNLQLQGRVRDLEADLAEAERHLGDVIAGPFPANAAVRAKGFLRKMAAKRERSAAQAKDIDAFLGQVAVDAARDGTNPSADWRGLEEAAKVADAYARGAGKDHNGERCAAVAKAIRALISSGDL